jgi:hypothetical protein
VGLKEHKHLQSEGQITTTKFRMHSMVIGTAIATQNIRGTQTYRTSKKAKQIIKARKQ